MGAYNPNFPTYTASKGLKGTRFGQQRLTLPTLFMLVRIFIQHSGRNADEGSDASPKQAQKIVQNVLSDDERAEVEEKKHRVRIIK